MIQDIFVFFEKKGRIRVDDFRKIKEIPDGCNRTVCKIGLF